ncbi:hypothetical protein AAZX31_13G038300 [Glycine max]|uniref:Pollen Ole e 1 allergen and extensin family protein n=2 Tax=Glycine subgen. Soja TaxID=1462606 RepID=I1LWW5_SOYBN|nr:vegetative cell wall protein gp1 [Glycine max]XP_028198202.1 vegetative cell wall protein gp1-like [Glycine soja]KAG4969652.1 hypothetical protein JHK85_036073 [Glycine max]KAG4976001.1 hypothetical protein JHK86_035475 [Glycine max]KAG5112077.1 hypothetical protein JHK82_035346 [Glycine max]KAG5129365.1 hypothetical protein JHK84_035762 [Glycine max]KAH1099940.1 hypothetical protein GYH30_035203 [Glycine max]|eukprot:XP_006593705.1 vegetative cell wall protein gp1 [Glycine max]
MSWLLIILFLSLTHGSFSETSHDKKLPYAVVVGTVYCDTCSQQEFSIGSHFISGASVVAECKDGNSIQSFKKEVKTNEHGEFKVQLPFRVRKHVRRIKGCTFKLLSSSEPHCSVASVSTSSVSLKTRKQGEHTFSAGLFSFKPLQKPNVCNQNQNEFSPNTYPSKPTPDKTTVFKTNPTTKSSDKSKSANKNLAEDFFFPPNPFFPPPLVPNPFQPPPLIPNPFQPPPLIPNPLQPPSPPLIPNPFQPPSPPPLIPNPFQPPPSPPTLFPNPFQPPPSPPPLIPNPFQPPPSPPPSLFPPFPPIVIPGLTPSPPPPPPPKPIFPPLPPLFPPLFPPPHTPGTPPASASKNHPYP